MLRDAWIEGNLANQQRAHPPLQGPLQCVWLLQCLLSEGILELPCLDRRANVEPDPSSAIFPQAFRPLGPARTTTPLAPGDPWLTDVRVHHESAKSLLAWSEKFMEPVLACPRVCLL